jgi:serine/threonine protein kinase
VTAVDDQIRAALPGYELGGQIGRGGCGVVLSAVHLRLQRQVAIKQIPPQFAQDSVIRRRFAAEAQLMASIEHPHVVPVYDFVEHDGMCLLVMEYLPGGSVADRFTGEGFDANSAIAVALACAAGLQAAHARGVLHRDIKPANLMFSATGTVKLTDFGIAKIVGGDETLVTRAGEIVGTPSYVAPEQARGQELSPATDVYALATMVYQLLSGVLPFPPGEDSMAVLFMHAFEKPTPLTEAAASVPKAIADVVMRGLATDPTERFASAESFGVALAEPAFDSWGTDWLTPVGIPVIGSDTILAAATGHRGSAVSAPPPSTTRGHRVRPAQPLSRPRIELADVDRDGLAPVQDVVKFRSPRWPFLIAGLLMLIAVAISLIGLGAPPRGGNLPPGTVLIAGVDPTRGEVTADLSKPIPITVTGVPGDQVSLSWNVLGASIGRREAPLVPGPQGSTAEVPPPVNPYIVAGRLTGEVAVAGPEKPPVTYRFGVRSTQSALTTAIAAGTVALALFAFSYLESYARALRRGRSRFSSSLGLPVSTAGLGLAVVGAAWVLLGHEPTIATLIGTGVLAAASGVATTVGAMRMGYRVRYRRARRAQERALALRRLREG